LREIGLAGGAEIDVDRRDRSSTLDHLEVCARLILNACEGPL
jgi:hypothetical protein